MRLVNITKDRKAHACHIDFIPREGDVLTPTPVKIYFDGGSRGNPGPAAGAAYAEFDGGRERSCFIASATNNEAEYRGLLMGIELAKELKLTHVTFLGDSKLVVMQVSGQWKAKHPMMNELKGLVLQELKGIPQWQIDWVRREFNSEADRVANQTMDKHQGIVAIPKTAAPIPQSAPLSPVLPSPSAPGSVSPSTEGLPWASDDALPWASDNDSPWVSAPPLLSPAITPPAQDPQPTPQLTSKPKAGELEMPVDSSANSARSSDAAGVPLRADVKKLNDLGSKASFSDFRALKVGGMDAFSRANPTALAGLLSNFQELSDNFMLRLNTDRHTQSLEPTEKTKLCINALRWTARGLAGDLPLRKILVDLEVTRNIRGKKS